MKRRFTLLLPAILLFFITNLSAQDIDVEWGKEREHAKKGEITGIIGNDDNGYYAIRDNAGKNSYTLIRYDMQHEIEFEREINITVAGQKGTWEGLYLLKDNLVLFLSRADGKKDKNTLYSCIISKDGKQEKPEEVDVINIKKKSNAGSFQIYLSEDKAKFLIVHQEMYEKKGYEKFNYKMFTEKLELVWEKPMELPYKDNAFSVGRCRIDEEGNVFVLGTIEVAKKAVQYKMFAYYFKKDKLEEVDVNFAKAYAVSNLQFNYINGSLVFVGFYKDSKKPVLQGIIYTKINSKTLETEISKTSAFTKKDLAKFTTEKKAAKAKGVTPTFVIRDLLVSPNGDLKIVSEIYYVQVIQNQSASRGANLGGLALSVNLNSNTYIYYYLNIMVVNIDNQGEIKWVCNVPKMQISKNDEGAYSSYILAYSNNKMYFVYNDNPKNTSPKTKEAKRGSYRADTQKINKLAVTLATVDEEGRVNTEMFFKSKNEGKTALKPKLYARFRQDNILIHAVKGKTYKFGFLNIKKA